MDQKEIDSLSNELMKYKTFLQQREEEIRQGKNNYSLIGSLLGIHDEVRLHSRFIYSMINPNGSHFQNDLFLKLFIECIDPKILKNFNLSNTQVFKERDNIDLLIEDGNTFIIIENKLRALDQEAQISRYIKAVQNNNDSNITIIVVYLSITGKNPDHISLRDDKEPHNVEKTYNITENNQKLTNTEHCIAYYPISYQYNITQWVKQSLLKISNVSNLYNAFYEYQNIINRVNKTMNDNSVSTFPSFILKQSSTEIDEYLQFSANVIQNLYTIWATQIINTIYSIPELKQLIISDEHNDLTIVEDDNSTAINKLRKWLNRSGKTEDYKDIKLCFYNKDKSKSNVLMFGILVLYIGQYDQMVMEVSNKDNKQKNSLFGVGTDFRDVITRPEIAATVCSRIKERIEQLINQ